MTRLLEFGLMATPLAAYLLWRILIHRGVANPSRNTLFALATVVVLMASGLFWMSASERHAEGTRYVPAQLRDGRVIPGHGA